MSARQLRSYWSRIVLVGGVLVLMLAGSAAASGLQDCRHAALGRPWTPQEMWTWGRLCAGERADLSAYRGSHVVRSSFVLETLTDRQLHAVLPPEGVAIAHAHFTGALQLAHHTLDQPLALEDSRFDETLDLSRLSTSTNLSLQGSSGGIVDLRYLHAGDVWLRDVTFSEVDLSNASIGGWIFADGASVRIRLDLSNAAVANSVHLDRSLIGYLNLSEAQIGSALSVKNASVTREVTMVETSIGRQAEFDNSVLPARNTFIGLRVAAHLRLPKTAGNIDLSGSQIDGDLLVLGSQLGELQLARAHVGGQVSLANSSVNILEGSGLTLTRDWSMEDTVVKTKLLLENAQVGGSVVFDRDTLPPAQVIVSHLTIAGNLNLFNDTLRGRTQFSNLAVSGDLQISGGTLQTLDLTGSKIVGDLLLAQYGRIAWQPTALFILHDVNVHAIEDRNDCQDEDTKCDAWAPRLDLSGLSYERLGSASAALRRSSVDAGVDGTYADYSGSAGNAPASTVDRSKHGHENMLDPLQRSEKWWKAHWFARQQPFSAEPYDELSSVLRRLGDEEMADRIMFDRHDDEAHFIRNPTLIVQRSVIGYGYDVWLAFPWAAALVLLGMLVLKITGEGKRLGLPVGATYSFDMLLPLVRLRESNYKLEVRGPAQYYFYAHKLAGFVLASFLLAALSGLTRQ